MPQEGKLLFVTELGKLLVKPGEICVIPRGIQYRVELSDDPTGGSRGYILEVFNGHFELPELGVIGTNGLANPRDFLYPVAHFEKTEAFVCNEKERGGISVDLKVLNTGVTRGTFTDVRYMDSCFQTFTKYNNQFYVAQRAHSCYDVVAWSGNYAPFKYNLLNFNTMNTVSFDHPDPSIFTVLTCRSSVPGVATADFAIFPERWMVAEGTFRPPYYHRNVMAEFMGNIFGKYDAKEEGFLPGGISLHNCVAAHGPDLQAFTLATHLGAHSVSELKPVKMKGSLAFMFETGLPLGVEKNWLECKEKQADYWKCWQGL